MGALIIGGFSYRTYWGYEQNQRLYFFASKGQVVIVPADCSQVRGDKDIDYIVASAKRIHNRKNYSEACWYALDRFKVLFPEAPVGDTAIVEAQFQKMDFPVEALRPLSPSYWPYVSMVLAVLLAVFSIFMGFFGLKKAPLKRKEPDVIPTVDATQLASDLAILRKRLENSSNDR